MPRIYPIIRRITTVVSGNVNARLIVKAGTRLSWVTSLRAAVQKPATKQSWGPATLQAARQRAATRVSMIATTDSRLTEKPATRVSWGPASLLVANPKAGSRQSWGPAALQAARQKPASNIVQIKYDLDHKSNVVTAAQDAGGTGTWTNPTRMQGVSDEAGGHGGEADFAGGLILLTGTLRGTMVAQASRPASLVIDSVNLDWYGEALGLPIVSDLVSSLALGFRVNTAPLPGPDKDCFTITTGDSSFVSGTGTPDASANARTGVLKGTVLPAVVTSPWAGFGNALSFDGVDRGANSSGVDCGVITNALNTSMTLECRFRRDRQNVTEILFGSWDGLAASGGLLIYLDSSNVLIALWVDSTGTNQSLSGAITTGEHEVAVSFDSSDSKMRLWRDGTLVATSAATSFRAIGGTANFWIGRSQNLGGSPPFLGVIDEVRLSSVNRYGTANYAPAGAPFTTDANTKGLWHLDTTVTAGTPKTLRIDDGAGKFIDGATPALSTAVTWANIARLQPYFKASVIANLAAARYYADAIRLRVIAQETQVV